MRILGICEGHDSGAALAEGGRIIAAVNEERLTRAKLQAGFPERAIREVLDITGTRPEEIGAVYASSHMTPAFILRLMQGRYREIRKKHSSFNLSNSAYREYHIIARKTPLLKAEAFANKRLTAKRLEKIGIRGRIETVEHHLAHAGGALAADEQAEMIVTMDDIGDGLSGTVSIQKKGVLERVLEQDACHSAGDFYAKITEAAGFRPGIDEGKIVGLAAYGNPAGAENVRGMLRHEKGEIRQERIQAGDFKGHEREDIAAAGQEALEKSVCGLVREIAEKKGLKKIALSGGVFANVKLNQRIMENGFYVSVYPHMGDGGLAAGALGAATGAKIDTLYLGREYADEDIEKALEESGLEHRKEKEIEKRVAGLLAEGKIIGRHNGRSEFGPRALGNRSILFEAKDSGLAKGLNERLKRDEFMPFAPATLEEKAGKCYKGVERASQTSRHMTISFECTEWMKENSPAAVHVDGTARPQIVDEKTNPGFYKILKEYERITGLPTLVNTSFNMHGEPIVYSPKDAINTYKKAGLDCLAIGDFLAR